MVLPAGTCINGDKVIDLHLTLVRGESAVFELADGKWYFTAIDRSAVR